MANNNLFMHMDDNTPDTPEMYKIYNKLGKVYSFYGDYYMLCQVEYCQFAMINLYSGNRKCDRLKTLEDLTDGMVEVTGATIIIQRDE